MDMVSFVLCALATARVTRLITTDRITQAPRHWVIRRLPRQSLWAYLLVCDWCSGMYAGAAVAGAWWLWGGAVWFTAATAALAFSYCAGLLASVVQGE